MKVTSEKVLKVLKTHIVPIIAVALLCFAAVFGYMKLCVAPTYYSNAKFYISRTENKNSNEVTTTRLLAETFIEILNTNMFFEKVNSALPDGLKNEFTADKIKADSKFEIRNGTEIIQIEFGDKNKDAVIPVIEALLSQVQNHLLAAYGDCSFHIVDNPRDVSISSSKASLSAVIAFLAGALITFLIFLLKDIMDVHVRSAADISARYDVPVIGTVPTFSRNGISKGGRKNG